MRRASAWGLSDYGSSAMGWMQLLSNLVGDVVWPVAVVSIAVVFRKPIAKLLPHLRRLEGPAGLKFEFDELAEHAEESSEALLPPGEAAPLDESDPRYSWVVGLRDLADRSPRAAVLEAFLKVEAEIRRLAAPFGEPRSVTEGARRLTRAGVIPQEVLPALNDLASMRNEAVHVSDFAVPPIAAATYIDAAANVVRALENIEPTAGAGLSEDQDS